MPPKSCLVLFRVGNTIVLRGIIVLTTINESLAMYLWGPDEDGQAWSFVYFLKSVKPMEIAASEINKAANLEPNWNWQGFTVVLPPAANAIIQLVKDVARKAP